MMKNAMRTIQAAENPPEELEMLKYSAKQCAELPHVPINSIMAILKEHTSINTETALRLAEFFGTTQEFWINLPRAYDLNTIPIAPQDAKFKLSVS